jgi:hypothetical protein
MTPIKNRGQNSGPASCDFGLAGVFVDEVEEFGVHGLLFIGRAGADGLGGAVGEVIAHQSSGYGAERLLHGGELGDDVGAVAVFFDHAMQAADLAFDEAEATEIGGFDLRVDGYSLASGFVEAGDLCGLFIFWFSLFYWHRDVSFMKV